jgi:hypothetical protein
MSEEIAEVNEERQVQNFSPCPDRNIYIHECSASDEVGTKQGFTCCIIQGWNGEKFICAHIRTDNQLTITLHVSRIHFYYFFLCWRCPYPNVSLRMASFYIEHTMSTAGWRRSLIFHHGMWDSCKLFRILMAAKM